MRSRGWVERSSDAAFERPPLLWPPSHRLRAAAPRPIRTGKGVGATFLQRPRSQVAPGGHQRGVEKMHKMRVHMRIHMHGELALAGQRISLHRIPKFSNLMHPCPPSPLPSPLTPTYTITSRGTALLLHAEHNCRATMLHKSLQYFLRPEKTSDVAHAVRQNLCTSKELT